MNKREKAMLSRLFEKWHIYGFSPEQSLENQLGFALYHAEKSGYIRGWRAREDVIEAQKEKAAR